MSTGTARQNQLKKLIGELIPHASFADSAPILEAAYAKKFKTLPPSIALWLSTVAHIRHQHSDYDALMDDGYDKDAARHFSLNQINKILKSWGCSRQLSEEDDEF